MRHAQHTSQATTRRLQGLRETISLALLALSLVALTIGMSQAFLSAGAAAYNAFLLADTHSLTGVVRVSGTAEVGETLSAEVTGYPSTIEESELVYRWFRDGVEVPDVTGPSYPLFHPDMDATITCHVTVEGWDGTLVSNPTGPIVQYIPIQWWASPSGMAAWEADDLELVKNERIEWHTYSYSAPERDMGIDWRMFNGWLVGNIWSWTYANEATDAESLIAAWLDVGGPDMAYEYEEWDGIVPICMYSDYDQQEFTLVFDNKALEVRDLEYDGDELRLFEPIIHLCTNNESFTGWYTLPDGAGTYIYDGYSPYQPEFRELVETLMAEEDGQLSRAGITRICDINEIHLYGHYIPLTATISGDAVVGGTLTCTVTGEPDYSTLFHLDHRYRWYADDDVVAEGTSNTYAPTADDAGKVISCTAYIGIWREAPDVPSWNHHLDAEMESPVRSDTVQVDYMAYTNDSPDEEVVVRSVSLSRTDAFDAAFDPNADGEDANDRYGYDVTGWRDASGRVHAPGADTALVSDIIPSGWDGTSHVTVHAEWQMRTITVQYDTGGYDEHHDFANPRTFLWNESPYVDLTGMWPGYELIWQSDDWGDEVTPETTVGDLLLMMMDPWAETMNVWLSWTPKTYTVTYYREDTVLMSREISFDDLVYIDPEGMFVIPEGYEFEGWYTQPDGAGTKVEEDGLYRDLVDNDDVDSLDLYANLVPKQAEKSIFAVYSADDESLTLYNRPGKPEVGASFEGKTATAVYTDFLSTAQPAWSEHSSTVKSVKVADEGISPTTTRSWFQYFTACTSFDVKALDTSRVTTFQGMFLSCTAVTEIDLSGWDVRAVTTANVMFSYNTSLRVVNLRGWSMPSCVNTLGMFSYSPALETIFASSEDWCLAKNMTTSGMMFTGCTSLRGGCGTPFDPNIVDATYARIDGLGSLPGYLTDGTAEVVTLEVEISGDEIVGGMLAASVTNAPAGVSDYAYQWNRDGMSISGDTAQTYMVTTADVGRKITCDVSSPSLALTARSNELEPKPSPTTMFAVYSADDSSLDFYRRGVVPQEGETFEGKTATAVYVAGYHNKSGFDPQIASGMSGVHVFDWREHAADVLSVTVKDEMIAPADMSSWFYDLSNCRTIDLSLLDMTNVTELRETFANCAQLTGITFPQAKPKNLTSMNATFAHCGSLTSIGGLSGFAVDAVTDMQYTFLGCSSLSSVAEIAGWSVGKVTSMYGMFSGCSALESVTPLSGWDVSSVTHMGMMFSNCTSLASVDALSEWDVSGLRYAQSMFAGIGAQNVNLSGWNVTGLASANGMFYGAATRTIDITGWDLASCTTTYQMFADASSLEAIYVSSDWELPSGCDRGNMFFGCELLRGGMGTSYVGRDYDNGKYAVIDGGPASATPGFLTCGDYASATVTISGLPVVWQEVSAVIAGHADTSTFAYQWFRDGWAIEGADDETYVLADEDAGHEITCRVLSTELGVFAASEPIVPEASAAETFAVYSADDESLTLYNRPGKPNAGASFEGKAATAVYMDFLSATAQPAWSEHASTVKSVKVADNGIRPTSTKSWFQNFSACTSFDVKALDTSAVTNFQGMFLSCASVASIDLSGWNTAGVTTTNTMFASCTALTTVNLSGWTLPKVTIMSYMFSYDSNLATIVVSDAWQVGGRLVSTNGAQMFAGCTSLVGGAGTGFDASKITHEMAVIDGGPSNPGYLSTASQVAAGKPAPSAAPMIPSDIVESVIHDEKQAASERADTPARDAEKAKSEDAKKAVSNVEVDTDTPAQQADDEAEVDNDGALKDEEADIVVSESPDDDPDDDDEAKPGKSAEEEAGEIAKPVSDTPKSIEAEHEAKEDK